jgi:hypothetical protein
MLSSDANPLESLIIDLDWDEDDFETVQRIFKEYDGRIREKTEPVLLGFGARIRERFGIDHQDLKQIILAFWRCNLWKNVCEEYARQSQVVEFHEILEAIKDK